MKNRMRIFLSAACGVIFLAAAVFACVNMVRYGAALKDNLSAAYLTDKLSVYGDPEQIRLSISELEHDIAGLTEACEQLDADTAQQTELAQRLDELSRQAANAVLMMQQEQKDYAELLKKYEQLQARYDELLDKYTELTGEELQ